MDWFEKTGFKHEILSSGTVRHYQKIANNNVCLYDLGKDDKYHPGKWYCVVHGNKICANEYADTKEEAFRGAMLKFKSSLEYARNHLNDRIAEIERKIDLI